MNKRDAREVLVTLRALARRMAKLEQRQEELESTLAAAIDNDENDDGPQDGEE